MSKAKKSAQKRSADWSQPADIDGPTFAFPASARHLMPAYETVPDEFKRYHNPWARFVDRWFAVGVEGAIFRAKDGVEGHKALRHVRTVLRSFEPKHEHKTSACAYLLSLWFERIDVDGKQVAP